MASSEDAIIARIEARLGPVGKGHHNAHRTEHLREWLRKKEQEKRKPRG